MHVSVYKLVSCTIDCDLNTTDGNADVIELCKKVSLAQDLVTTVFFINRLSVHYNRFSIGDGRYIKIINWIRVRHPKRKAFRYLLDESDVHNGS